MHSFLIASFLSLSLSLASPAVRAAETDAADIERVMAEYHAAVVAHDGGKIASLFLPEGSTWLNVLSDPAYVHAAAASPGAAKVRVGSFHDFAKFVSTTDKSLNPTQSNVKIVTDGTVASVTFDFVFFIDGAPVNRGAEAWQLVKGVDGWRIAALTYSSNPS